jgi:hypothetical protein
MARCYLRGYEGSVLNAHLVAAAWNFRKWMRKGALFAQIWKLRMEHLERIETIPRAT